MNSRTSQDLIESLDAMLADVFPELSANQRRQRLIETLGKAPAPVVTKPCEAQPSDTLRVNLLGRFEAHGPAGRIDEGSWTTQKSMLLFTYLVNRSGRSIPDSALMGAFWGDRDDEHSRGSLRNAIYQVRLVVSKALGADLQLDRNRRSRAITLTHPVEVDTDVFEQGVQEAAACLDVDAPAAALEVLQRVMPLYRGELLEGFDDEWIETRRAHLAELHLRGLGMMIRCRLALGEAAAAEQTARYAIPLDDLREEFHGGLMAALVAQGRRAEAFRHYQDLVEHYEREIGLTPSTVRDLYDSLLGDVAQVTPVASPQPRLANDRRRRAFTWPAAETRVIRAVS